MRSECHTFRRYIIQEGNRNPNTYSRNRRKSRTDALAAKLGDNEFEEEILDIFKYIMKNSRRIQAKSLFDYNIFLIGFMGAGKSTVAGELKDKLEMDRVEMDQMIVENRGMSISEIFDEFGEAYFRNLESNTLIELQKRKQTIVPAVVVLS